MTIYIKRLLVILLVVSSATTRAQSNYNPIVDDKAKQSEIEAIINSKYALLLDAMPSTYKKDYNKLYKELHEERLKGLKKGYYIYDPKLETFFNYILAEIKKGNPNLDLSGVSFLVTRDYSPNATASVDNIITFNLGMLANVSNESQVASILCHEIGHYLLQHPAKTIAKAFYQANSKTLKRDIKKINKDKAQAAEYKRVDDYLLNMVYSLHRHSRLNEAQADSLGVSLFMNTRYAHNESANSMLLLDTLDNDLLNPNFNIQKILDFPDYPFKSKWLESHSTLFEDGKRVFDDSLARDSIKTHPDCKKRAKKLESFVAKQDKDKTNTPHLNLQADSVVNKMIRVAKYETLLSEYQYDNIDLCLFHTLKLVQEEPDNIFLHMLVGKCFNLLYRAQKEHRFSTYVSLVNIYSPKKYKRFIEFLNNLRLIELGNIAYHYLKLKPVAYQEDENFLYELILATKNIGVEAEVATLKAQYNQLFPKGKYTAILKTL